MSRAGRSLHGAPAPLEPELQQVLGEANQQYAAPRDEAAAFRRLTLALERQSPERGLRPWLWVCAGVGAAALALLVQARSLEGARLEEPAATLRMAPEPPLAAPGLREARESSSPATAELAPPSSELEREPAPEPEPALERTARAQPQLEPQRDVRVPRRSSPLARAEREAPGGSGAPADEDCLALARDGQVRPAESCFERRAQGAGLSAEMALYELARLRRDVLGDAEGALAALGDYRQRFPAGSLRSEVDVSRVELLARLQRGQEALQASGQLLATPAGKERALELRLLRGNVYRAAGSLREAIGEYASAERLGGSLGAEATFLRAQCLEALGELAAAREAYALAAQSAGPRRGEAQERLSALQRSLEPGAPRK